MPNTQRPKKNFFRSRQAMAGKSPFAEKYVPCNADCHDCLMPILMYAWKTSWKNHSGETQLHGHTSTAK